MSQSHFSDDHSHFYLGGKDGQRTIKPKQKRAKGSKPFFCHTSDSQKGSLAEKAEIVRGQSMAKKTIFDDRRLYFVIAFSDSLSWKSVSDTLKQLEGELTEVYGDRTVKLAIRKNAYDNFVEALERGRKYISDISESSGSDKIDAELARALEENPLVPQKVTIEVVDVSGLKLTSELETALKRFAQEHNGEIELGYSSEKFAVFTATLSPMVLNEISEKVEIVEHVRLMPAVSLASLGGVPRGISLASVISMANTKPKQLPIVCAIDTGINRNHTLLHDYIADVHDFSSSPPSLPCEDGDGHGSMVAGVLVYGGSCNTHTEPVARVIMAKGFERHDRVLGDILQNIVRTIEKFASRTKVFNFSFAAFGPNPSLTKVIEDMAYYRDITIVACAGNIATQAIKNELENHIPYPNYLQRHHIYFPGDSKNAITVGSFASVDSNICRKNSPSPFTCAGIGGNWIKPDVLEDGGNMNANWNGNEIIEFDHSRIGISSASFRNNHELLEDVGTSFSCPAVAALAANILDRYPNASQALVKAIVLSSSSPLSDSSGSMFDKLIQGLGRPDFPSALNSTRWRTCYLLQDAFDGTVPRPYKRYRFLFPDNADRLTITIVSTRPADSKTYLRFRLVKSGAKVDSTPPKPREYFGSFRVGTTYQSIYDVKRGGKGLWTMDIWPLFDHTLGVDPGIKYGCVISIESGKHKDVFSQIASWMPSQVRQPSIAQTVQAS
jgi:hypothetical protein